MKKKYWIDPPSGWRYGFPKVIEIEEGDPFEPKAFLLANGYPDYLLVNGIPMLRYWDYEEGVDVYDPSSLDSTQCFNKSMFKMEEGVDND